MPLKLTNMLLDQRNSCAKFPGKLLATWIQLWSNDSFIILAIVLETVRMVWV